MKKSGRKRGRIVLKEKVKGLIIKIMGDSIDEKRNILKEREEEEQQTGQIQCTGMTENNKMMLSLCKVLYVFVFLMLAMFIKARKLLMGLGVTCVWWCLIAFMHIYYYGICYKESFVLTKDSLIYTNPWGKVKSYRLEELKKVKRKISTRYYYRFYFVDRKVNLYDGDNLSRLLIRLQKLGKYDGRLP